MTTETTLPGVGDLVRHGDAGGEYVVSDIRGQLTENPVWDMRPRSGGWSTTPVRKDTIEQWGIVSRVGEWKEAW